MDALFRKKRSRLPNEQDRSGLSSPSPQNGQNYDRESYMSPTPGRTSNAFSSAPMGSPLSISGPSSNPHVSKDGRAPSHVSEFSASLP